MQSATSAYSMSGEIHQSIGAAPLCVQLGTQKMIAGVTRHQTPNSVLTSSQRWSHDPAGCGQTFHQGKQFEVH